MSKLAGRKVTDATLRLYHLDNNGPVGAGGTAFRVNFDWQSNPTWNNHVCKPLTAGGQFCENNQEYLGEVVGEVANKNSNYDIKLATTGWKDGTHTIVLRSNVDDSVNYSSAQGVQAPQLILSTEETSLPIPTPSPTPVPTPQPSNSSAEQRPFDPSHPVYQPIPANVKLDPNSSAVVSNIVTNYPTFFFDTHQESPPIYVGDPNNSGHVNWTIKTNGKCIINGRSIDPVVRAPLDIKPGVSINDNDYPLVILDKANKAFTTNGTTQPTEFRMWRAVIDSNARTITPSGFGAGSYRNDGGLLTNQLFHSSSLVKRALGQAEACGQNTGSGESYTVGMIRPIDVERGRIDHAIRVGAGYVSPSRINWPAILSERNEQSGGGAINDRNLSNGVPMGARIFLDKSVDVEELGNQVAAQLTNVRQKAFAKIFVKALQEYGMIVLDDAYGSNRVYFEGVKTNPTRASSGSRPWDNLIGGQVDSFGSYNNIARTIGSVLPWDKLHVADPSVFNNYGR